MSKIVQGTWVEIEQVVLKPEERAPTLPEETKLVPYILHASGFLVKEAEIGQEVRIHTIIGRELTGKLIVVNPSYTHSFGDTVPELLKIGTQGEDL
ncbi:MAG TPA: 2-amino-4-oxopentanoate thiolase subunit OrtA [Anaerolineaceae bacterium]|nr:2-amino-4-oxopentanoate thiolase subunit OrtA [Anaerolineaceae bacterium]